MKRTILIEVIIFLLILLFAYTAISKIMTFSSFKYVLSKSPALQLLAPVLAWAIPAIEIIVVVLLVIPRTRNLGLWGSFFLLLLFTVYITYMLLFTPDRPCNCGGVLKEMTWNQHLLFNIFFTTVSLWGIYLMRKEKTTSVLQLN